VPNEGENLIDREANHVLLKVTSDEVKPYEYALGRSELAIDWGKIYELSFEAKSSNNQPFEAFIRQEGGDWKDYTQRVYGVAPGDWKKFTIVLLATDKDPKATMVLHAGFKSGNFEMRNINLKEAGQAEVKQVLNKHWWISENGRINYMTGSAVITVFDTKDPEKSVLGCNNLAIEKNKKYLFTFMAYTIEPHPMPIDIYLRKNKDDYAELSDRRRIEIGRIPTIRKVEILANESDPKATLASVLGFEKGEIVLTGLDFKEVGKKEPKKPVPPEYTPKKEGGGGGGGGGCHLNPGASLSYELFILLFAGLITKIRSRRR
jgi:hypothetical protein